MNSPVNFRQHIFLTWTRPKTLVRRHGMDHEKIFREGEQTYPACAN